MSERENMTADELIWDMPKGLVKWYRFKEKSSALYVTADTKFDSAMAEGLSECGLYVDSCNASGLLSDKNRQKYDYIIIASAIERLGDVRKASRLLRKVQALLNEDGTLFLGMDNRLGIRYFCGDRDYFTGRSFDGIENYIRAGVAGQENMAGRCYAKSEIVALLENAGFMHHRFYSVFPVLERPQILFAEDYTPNEKVDIRIFPQYNCPDTVFLEEEQLYDTLIKNELFHTMANGFWIECPSNACFANTNQITMSMDRGKDNAMFTIIRRDDQVEKKPVYPENCNKVKALMDNNLYLLNHGINMVDAVLENDSFVMPYIHEMSALEYLRRVALQDENLFFAKLDNLWELILSSSEHTPYSEIDWEHYEPHCENGKKDDPARERWKKIAYGEKGEQGGIGPILKRGYIDLVPLNCFWDNARFMFYDQELFIENLPAKVILLRTIDLVYMGERQLYNLLPIEDVREKYGLNECKDLFYKFIGWFLNDLRLSLIHI